MRVLRHVLSNVDQRAANALLAYPDSSGVVDAQERQPEKLALDGAASLRSRARAPGAGRQVVAICCQCCVYIQSARRLPNGEAAAGKLRLPVLEM